MASFAHSRHSPQRTDQPGGRRLCQRATTARSRVLHAVVWRRSTADRRPLRQAEHVDRSRAGADARAGRRPPPPRRSPSPAERPRAARGRARDAPRAPTSACSPSHARRRPGCRSPGISTSCSPSKKRSIASSRWPPVTTTARGPSACTARASSSGRRLLARRSRAPVASGRFGVSTVDARQQQLAQRVARAPVVEQRRAALGDHHRDRAPPARLADQVERVAPRPRSSRRCRASRSSPRRPRCRPPPRPPARRSPRGGSGYTLVTSTVFCAVTAVIAVIPCTPQRANALRSAWIPAPPPESEPAIDSARGTRLPFSRVGHRRRA